MSFLTVPFDVLEEVRSLHKMIVAEFPTMCKGKTATKPCGKSVFTDKTA
jgi:hypothetical protein